MTIGGGGGGGAPTSCTMARAVRVGTRCADAVAVLISRRGPPAIGACAVTLYLLCLPLASERIVQHGVRCRDAAPSTAMNVIPEPEPIADPDRERGRGTRASGP